MVSLDQLTAIGPLFFLLAPCLAAALGREWTAEQQDVWKNEEAYWMHRAQGNVQEWAALLHEDFAGWPSWAAVPIDKAAGRRSIEEEVKSTEILFYDLRPTAIKVFGNVGIVYYYISMVKRTDSRAQTVSSRYLHIWLKRGATWKMIGGDSVPNSR